MRPFAILVFFLFVAAGLAGCVNGAGDTPTASATDGENVAPAADGKGATTPAARPGSGLAPRVAPLSLSVSASGPSWIASGDSVPMKATAVGSTGALRYAWATGPLPAASDVKVVGLDTKVFDPGANKSLKFAAAGVYAMHCHPHPFMKHNVTVIDGYQGPSRVTVLITDGATNADYRFSPENIVVGVGTEVVYENVGKLPHSATQEGQEPALKLAKLDAASGDVAVEGEGWMRVVAIATDSTGRSGVAEAPVYLTKELPKDFTVEISGTFRTPLYQPELEMNPEPAVMESFRVDHPATFTFNITATDAAGIGKVAARLVRVATDAEVTSLDATASGTMSAELPAGDYELFVEPSDGVNVEFAGVGTIAYLLVPPPPMPPGAAPAGEDPHAGH